MKNLMTVALGISIFFGAASAAFARPCAAVSAPYGNQTRCIKKHHHHHHHYRMHNTMRNRMR